MAIIDVRNVSKSFRIPSVRRDSVRDHAFDLFRRRPYERLRVLEDISFSVERGETLGIMGRNGCGKSTLLKILCGIYQPDTGAVAVRGGLTPILELGVGWNPNLTAVDNVYLMGTVMGQGIAITGPWFSHHFRMDPAIFDFEIGVPVARSVAAAGRVIPGELPARTVARTVYHGSYEGLGSAWGEFNVWIEAQGHVPAADLWECYVAGPESGPDPSEWRTELNRPLIL